MTASQPAVNTARRSTFWRSQHRVQSTRGASRALRSATYAYALHGVQREPERGVIRAARPLHDAPTNSGVRSSSICRRCWTANSTEWAHRKEYQCRTWTCWRRMMTASDWRRTCGIYTDCSRIGATGASSFCSSFGAVLVRSNSEAGAPVVAENQAHGGHMLTGYRHINQSGNGTLHR